MTTLFNIALEKILVYVTLNIKPASAAATNVFSWLIVPQQSIPESRYVVLGFTIVLIINFGFAIV